MSMVEELKCGGEVLVRIVSDHRGRPREVLDFVGGVHCNYSYDDDITKCVARDIDGSNVEVAEWKP